MFDLKNKVAVITGGANGIGKATALLFAKQNAEVHILDMNEEAAKAVAEEVTVYGGKRFFHICDVTKQQQVKEIFDSIKKVDILVNSAGISHIGKLENTSEEDFDKIYNVNVKGVYSSKGRTTVCGTVRSLFKSGYSPYINTQAKAKIVQLVRTLISCIKNENSNFSSGFYLNILII